ncbi:MAG: peptidylprolyl isomerase [Planctomycetes bacterium]|nr:peptidylprolyl isomerase [Planctomycetota bacterium]
MMLLPVLSRLLAASLAGAALAGAALAAAAAGPAPEGRPFATVGDTVLSAADYQRALAVAMRRKYYHAKPPEAELALFQREVGDELVNRVLLLDEAKRRGLQPDRRQIDATVAGYDRQYRGSANWAANRDRMLAAVLPQLERDSLFEQLQQSVRRVAAPDAVTARAYYEGHRELFVEPEQVKLGVILLRVDPSSPQSAWDGAWAEARTLHAKLQAGADFAELARLHSGDRSAARGGAMDYTHRGMLPEAVHGIVDALQPGQLGAPVQLLEGVAILRLDDRRAAVQRRFEDVRERAAELWQRDEGEARWKALIAQLRRGATIRIDESHYAPLRATTEKARSG